MAIAGCIEDIVIRRTLVWCRHSLGLEMVAMAGGELQELHVKACCS